MRYPTNVNVMGRHIDVHIVDKPIGVAGENDKGEELYITGQYDPLTDTIKVFHMDDKPSIGGHNFVHEIIEAINSHGDLQMNHTQISTVASALYNTFTNAGVSFAMAA